MSVTARAPAEVPEPPPTPHDALTWRPAPMPKGRVEAVSSTVIRMRVQGVTSEFLLQDIARIEQRDGLKNGALAGLVFGAIVGVISGATDRQGRGHRGMFVAGATAGAAIAWMGWGALIDAAVPHRTVIYERAGATVAVATALKPNERSVAASIVIQF